MERETQWTRELGKGVYDAVNEPFDEKTTFDFTVEIIEKMGKCPDCRDASLLDKIAWIAREAYCNGAVYGAELMYKAITNEQEEARA